MRAHQQHSVFLEVANYQMHIKHLKPAQPNGKAILMLHGAVENGRIFYSANGKGLGCFLADHGFDVFCADFAGRGLSCPHVRQGFQHNQHQLITCDIPALIEHVYQYFQRPLALIAHSWGGVVAAAALARFPALADKVAAKICFGTKRVITVRSLERKLKINVMWNTIAPWLCRRYGYLPARQFRFGADDEPAGFLTDTVRWIAGQPFIDITDQYNYADACKKLHWPPVWHFAGANDHLLGHPNDVKHFITESAASARYTLLGKQHGYSQDYDHISMLTHPSAQKEHFVQLRDWLMQLS